MTDLNHIQGDVVVGKAGELFLASGAHRVFEIVTGQIPINDDTVSVFEDNITSRFEYARSQNQRYLHVIFPDKQSVLPQLFITQTPIKLGEYFLDHIGTIQEQILYPLKILQNAGSLSFLKTDTHLSHLGTIIVVGEVVKRLTGIDCSEDLSILSERLTDRRYYCGDLGMKLDPPQGNVEAFLDFDWHARYFHNGILGGNNGAVDIYVSPFARHKKKLLWLGDSFGKEAARILSYFFSEILFLRTPFFHPEFVDQMQPDYIVTENVERYLISCTPDESRPFFHVFPFLTGKSYAADCSFAQAFSAILSFPRSPYVEFMARVQEESSQLVDPISRLLQARSEGKKVIMLSGNSEKANQLNIVPTIHPHDFIFKFVLENHSDDEANAVAQYYDLGSYSANLLGNFISEVTRVKTFLNEQWTPTTLLDFASGYGCVARHLKNVVSNIETVSTCDIHEDAIKFNQDILGITSYQSSVTPELLDIPPQDVIIALSFFSHMPLSTFGRWLSALADKVKPGGMLLFTANGHVTEQKGVTGITVGADGFGFHALSEQKDLDEEDYGLTISHVGWVLRIIEQIPTLRLARFEEGCWWAIQDVYVCIRC
jgi:hypothetical protein